MIWESMALGLLGGTARACVGLLKALRTKAKIKWQYTLVTILTSAIIGAAAGILLDSDAKMSVIAGYIGTDLLENTYKIITKKQQL